MQLTKEQESSGTAAGATSATGANPREPSRRKKTVVDYLARYGMLGAFTVLLLVFLITNADFRQPQNLLNVLQQSSMIGIVACGMTVMIIAGGFDLSVGAIGAASAVGAAAVMAHSGLIFLGVLGGLVIGLVAGLFNGFVIARIGITPFVATLGSSTLITGIVFAETNAVPISGIPAGFIKFGLGKVGAVPIPVLVFAAIAVLTYGLLRFSRMGHYVYSVGSSREASRLAGVPVERVLLFAFVVGGIFAGLAGLLLLGQTGIGQPSAATDWPLTAIAAVVVGGTPLRGGVGGVHSAIIGTLLLGVLANALNLYGVSPYWQPAVTGLVILLAVGVDSYQRKRTGGSV